MIKCTEKHVLNNGVEIPVIGFGSYMMHENTVAEAVKEAIHTGYRLIDHKTAARRRCVSRSGSSNSSSFKSRQLIVGESEPTDIFIAASKK